MSTPPYPPPPGPTMPPGPPVYGQPVFGPPYGPPGQPPPKRGHMLRNLLIIGGVLAVLCCGGVITGGVFLFKGVLDAIKPAEDATSAFITDLEAGNYSDAYGMLCAGTQAGYTVDRFSQVAQAQPQISGYRITSANVNSTNGHSTATVTAQLRQADGAAMSHIFMLVKENGTWKVCGQPY